MNSVTLFYNYEVDIYGIFLKLNEPMILFHNHLSFGMAKTDIIFSSGRKRRKRTRNWWMFYLQKLTFLSFHGAVSFKKKFYI